MITVQVDGVQYSQLKSVELGMSLSAIARDFSLTVAQPAGTALPFRGGERVQIFVDGELRLDGSIFTVRPIYSKSGHDIVMTGRSKVADLVDSSIQPITIAADISLQRAIEKIISTLGLDLIVINEVDGLPNFNSAEDKLTAEAGENAFEFIDRLARKRQALLTSDASGNVVITRNSTQRNPGTLFNPASGSGGNILSGDIEYNLENRFNRYLVMSQKNGSADFFSGSLDPQSFVDQQGEAIDSQIRPGRQMVMQAEKASSDGQAKNRATWQANIARVRSRKYAATVRGVRPDGGEIWQPNRLQQVVDEQAGIDEVLLIDSVRFHQSRQRGTITRLEFADADAYDIILSEPAPARTSDNPYAQFG